MNIKSLLFGSAAALVAVSGARAADAVVVAEPEPVEYVRVCDTYGVGFYYIPGTETCLRISGLVRYDIDYSEDDEYTVTQEDLDRVDALSDEDREEALGALFDQFEDNIDAGAPVLTDIVDVDGSQDLTAGDILLFDGLDDGWAKKALARVNIDARSETEYGTLRRFIRIEGDVLSGADTGGVDVIYAYIELGGILIGLYDTLYDGDISPEFDSAGGSSAHQIRYTFTGANGITFQVSLEEQDYNFDYTPNVVARFAITQGWGGVAVFGAYDATTEEFGAKGIVSFNATPAILLELLATYESGYGDFSVGTAHLTGYEFSLAGAVSFKASDRITIRGGGQYFWNQHTLGHDNYRVGGNVDFTVVENLLLRFQASYNGGDSQDFFDARVRVESVF